MKILNNGSTRIVILVGKYAIKIPRFFIEPDNKFYGKLVNFLFGWVSNRKEYLLSKNQINDDLLPVKKSFLWSMIIIMDKAEPITREEFFNLNQEDFNFGHEHKLDSYGKVNNKIYVIDYGN